jgi:tetratricopeptide (TPR) repeat protein
MPYTIKFFFSFIFLCGIFLSSRATGLKGDSLYASGRYFEASIEYERIIFNAKSQDELYHCKYKKALCYKQLKNFDRALDELQPMYFSNSNDSLFQRVCYEQSLCFYLNGEPSKALWKIDEYFHRSADTVSYLIFMPVKLLCLNETLQWKDAHECLLHLIQMQNFSPEKEAEMQQMVNNLYKKRNLPNIRSIKKAENLSRFLPGSGQVYAGKTGEGIANFLINASILAFSASQAYNGFYITGYLAGLGFFNKTYHGGIKRAGILVSQKNKELIANFNNGINATIRSNFGLN